MPRVAVVTDSNSGITVEEGRQLGVEVVPMPVLIDGKIYYEGVDLTQEEFYQKQVSGADIATSQPAPGDVIAVWGMTSWCIFLCPLGFPPPVPRPRCLRRTSTAGCR